MSAITCIVLLACAFSGTASLSGRVLDTNGNPIEGAQVFLEPGLALPLFATRSGSGGAFQFKNVPSGTIGVFAVASGHAFDGFSVPVAVSETISDTVVKLGIPDVVEGQIADFKGEPVSGARVTGAVLLGESKVGIPLGKLVPLGFREPFSDAKGRFTVAQLPLGGKVALKVAHPGYAQEGVSDVTVGTRDLRITLIPGILIRGEVLWQGTEVPVVNAPIIVKNAQPPYDTATVGTDTTGGFALRLKPGVYLYQASSTDFGSPGWQKLTVSGEQPDQRVTVRVAGMGQIRGKVCDARSGRPIEGTRLAVTARGHASAVLHTGPTGEFEASVPEGESVVTLESVPGYLLPAENRWRITVVAGKAAELPVFWLAPAPTFHVQVLDPAVYPCPDTVITILRPAQLGWHVADPSGRVAIRFAALQSDAEVIGLAEHVSKPLGAIFAVKPNQAASATVQLFHLGSVTGRVVSTRGKEIEGAVVGALLISPNSADNPPVLWQTVTRKDGSFQWHSVVPYVPQQCVARTGEASSDDSATLSIAPGGSKNLGRLVVPDGASAKSLHGEALKWLELRPATGPAAENLAAGNGPAVVMYCESNWASAAVEGLAQARRLLQATGLAFVAVVPHGHPVRAETIPVLWGAPPGAATTYLLGLDGKVALETFGMPPLRALQYLRRPAPKPASKEPET